MTQFRSTMPHMHEGGPMRMYISGRTRILIVAAVLFLLGASWS